MLPLHKLSSDEIHKIRVACSYLFSPELAGNEGFLRRITLDSVKSAFRKKAKQYHPDLHGNESGNMAEKRQGRFIKIRDSYEVLKSYVYRNDESEHRGVRRRKIVAVGGAKGGIGKTIFSANLGVMLAFRGRLTVLVDLDLGGANLHLYLGETFLESSINDFLTNRAPTLEEIMVLNRYGVELIGGDSSQLGAANVNFSRKLKLLKSIRELDAEYVICDLGGDTCYNVIDFFLAADHGLVLTTCDPASYLEAYNFIKVALYRKLSRLFGPESDFTGRKDFALERLINKATAPSSTNRVNSIAELIERVKKHHPRSLFLIKRALKTFKPGLIVNMTGNDSSVMEVVNRIREVSQTMLSIQVGYLGSIAYQPEIKASAKDLTPAVARHPDGIFADTIGHIIDKIGR
ncbi:MAG: P-loop NTPase [Desulfobacterales bacterium]|nr:P-loop NTPase [Desulfobacterales bacterium]